MISFIRPFVYVKEGMSYGTAFIAYNKSPYRFNRIEDQTFIIEFGVGKLTIY